MDSVVSQTARTKTALYSTRLDVRPMPRRQELLRIARMIDTIAALSGLAAGVIIPPVTRRSALADRVDQTARSIRVEQDRFELNATIDETEVGPTYDRNGRLTGSARAASPQTAGSPGADSTTASDADSDAAASNAVSADAKASTGSDLTPEDRQQVEKLKKRDAEVRAHEQAHKSAGGELAGGVSYTMQRGPDGQQYAVGGEVPIDVTPVKDDPEATIAKMQRVRQAALAPADPSSQDQAVAAEAGRIEQQARAEAAKKSADKSSGSEYFRLTADWDSSDDSSDNPGPGSLLDVTV
jgi:hypothetical protein